MNARSSGRQKLLGGEELQHLEKRRVLLEHLLRVLQHHACAL